MTTAINAQHSFIQAADLAYMQVASGAMSYDQAIRAAVQDVAEKGLSIINYASGRKEQLDVAMRRMVLTGVSQTTGNLQMARADDMGVDLVQTSAHIGARPAHQAWQGKIFSRSGTSKQYPDFVLSTGYGTGAGLMGWNCRHSFYPFFEGISENAYSQAELDSYADKTVTYNGQEIPMYDATQMQRGIERKIRHWKRQEGALDAAGLDSTAETAKVKHYQEQMKSFIKETKLDRQRVREQISYVSDLNKSIDPAKINFKSGEYQRISNLGDVRSLYQPHDLGINYATSKPVIYNHFAADHLLADDAHKIRLPWLQKNADGFVRAINSPDFIEKSLRLRRDGYFSATHIVELFPGGKDEERFMTVAISLSKNLTKGYHQVTTVHPARWRDIFKADGTLRDKYVKVK